MLDRSTMELGVYTDTYTYKLSEDQKEIFQEDLDLLEKHRPNWREEIDKEILDLGSRKNCILGQLFGDYSEGLKILGIDEEFQNSFDPLFERFWYSVL